MHKSLTGLIGAMSVLISVAPAAYALPASQAPAVNIANSGSALEPAELVIAPRPDHNYHRDYHRPVYHRDYHHADHNDHHNHGPAIIIR